MNTKLLLSLIFLAMLTLGSVCCKEEIETYYLDQEFKDYVIYNPGSYWIYEDSATSQRDSVFLLSQENFIKEMSSSNTKSQTIFQTFYTSSINDTVNAKAEAESMSDFFYYFNGNFIYAQSALYSSKITFLDSIKIDYLIFREVKIFEQRYGFKYYWVKKTGLIRKEIQGTIWNLKKYHIN